MSWDQYSQTPASNYISGYFLTGMAPSSVKVAGSNIMADLAQFMSLPTATGSANAQVVTNTRQFGALFTGMLQWFLPVATNTGAVTLAVDGLTAKNIFANGAAAIAGQLVSGVPALCKYDGTQWNLLNPSRVTGSYTGTGTGFTGSVTRTVKYEVSPDGVTVKQLIPQFNGTSNAVTGTITGMPAALSPASIQAWPCHVTDNSGANSGSVAVGIVANVITFGSGRGIGGSAFTASGTKAYPLTANSAFLEINYSVAV